MKPIRGMSESMEKIFNQANEDVFAMARYFEVARNGYAKPRRRNQHDWVSKPISKKPIK